MPGGNRYNKPFIGPKKTFCLRAHISTMTLNRPRCVSNKLNETMPASIDVGWIFKSHRHAIGVLI